jgi:hypothetical protein
MLVKGFREEAVRVGADAADIAKQEAELRAVLQRGLDAALTHNTTALSRHRRCVHDAY